MFLRNASEASENWAKVQTDDDYTGWVRAGQIRLLDEQEEYPQQGKVYRVNAL